MGITQLKYETSEYKTTNPPQNESETVICTKSEIKRIRTFSCGGYSSKTEETAVLNETDFEALSRLCNEEAIRKAAEKMQDPNGGFPQPFAPQMMGGSRSAALTVETNGDPVCLPGAYAAPFQEAINKMLSLAAQMRNAGMPSGFGIPVQAQAAAPAARPAAGNRFCPECGTPATNDAPFCSECGAKLI